MLVCLTHLKIRKETSVAKAQWARGARWWLRQRGGQTTPSGWAALHRVQSQPPSPTGWKHCVAQAPSPQNDTWGFCSSLSKSNSEVVATWSMATAVAEGKKARQIRHWLLKVPSGRDIHHFHRHVSHRTHTIWRGQESVILSVIERRTGSAEKKLRTLPSGQWGWGGVTSRQIS